ncbi:hypothetical protein FRX31_021788 [Thalictrum thalictroides]|uniref:Bulb-type lectin domain-containing protein n=1 Tax=Thalictrum thalictroides TaxID=46969 RepID=A0A7J6VU58_THATH|nr:hypothetical protein FRX31_021788 [Thalictrum thalictroides]
MKRNRLSVKPLFWTADPDNCLLSSPSSIILDKEGLLKNSNAEVIWQSFDYPTDTIVQGQSLKSGGSLMSLKSEDDGYGGNSSHVALNLNTDGKFYLVDSNSVMIMNLTNDELDEDAVFWTMDQFENIDIGNDSLYRATLGSDGCLRLFKEKIGFGSNRSVLVWSSDKDDDFPCWLFFIICLCFGSFIMLLWCLFPCCNCSSNKSAAGAEC